MYELQHSYISCYILTPQIFIYAQITILEERPLYNVTAVTVSFNGRNQSFAVVRTNPSPTAHIGAAAFCIIFPYFKLHHVSRLDDELAGGESIVGLVLLFVRPVEVEGRVATESCCPYCVRVKTPIFFVGRPFC